jgi:hypothetical protein
MGSIAFQIFVSDNPAALKRSKGEAVLGPFWVAIGSQLFPKAEWLDYPVAALANWTYRCLKLKNEGDSAQLMFFEGEVRIRIEQIEDELVKITAVDAGVDGATCITSKGHLWNELARAGHVVLSQCSSLGWPSPDWNQLWDNLDKHKHPFPMN